MLGVVTAGQASHNSSNVGVVTASQVPYNSSNVGVVSASQAPHNRILLRRQNPKQIRAQWRVITKSFGKVTINMWRISEMKKGRL